MHLWMVKCLVPFRVTVTLTSHLVFRIIVCGVYLLYYFMYEFHIWCVWVHLGMAECQVPFSGHHYYLDPDL